MTYRMSTLIFSLCLVALSALVVFSAGQNPAGSAQKKPYVRTGSEVTLSGTVNFTGKRPLPQRIDMSADPSCYDLASNPKTEWVEGTKGRLANVIVYVKSEVLDAYEFAQPTSPAVLEHRGCRYVPHVLGMQLGQSLKIFNRDPTHHNTHPTPKKNAEWNQTQSPGGPPIERTPELPETFIPFKDNQHPWERAYVGIFTHPFYAISDKYGNYKIEGLPPGQYSVTAWHERLGEKTIDIVFVPGEARYLGFSFSAKDGDFSDLRFTN